MQEDDPSVPKETRPHTGTIDFAASEHDKRRRPIDAPDNTSNAVFRTATVLRNSAIFAALFVLSVEVASHPGLFDGALAVRINKIAMEFGWADVFSYWASYPTVQGILIVSLFIYGWFSVESDRRRARLIIGIASAVIAGVFANSLQHIITSSPKPLFDPTLGLHAPSVLDLANLATGASVNLHTFPSPRATLFSGIAIAIFLVRRKFGLIVLLCTAVPEFARIFLGLHYPNDIVGSFLLSAAFVWFGQLPVFLPAGTWLVNWSIKSPASFYLLCYVACFEITNTFEELRLIAHYIFAR